MKLHVYIVDSITSTTYSFNHHNHHMHIRPVRLIDLIMIIEIIMIMNDNRYLYSLQEMQRKKYSISGKCHAKIVTIQIIGV